jgi:iron complex outermembrane recepter protein
MPIQNKTTLKLVMLTSVSFFGTQPLLAQDAPAADPQDSIQLEEIVVTAQKRNQNLQDVPAAISAISGDNLDRAAQFETQDLAKSVPSLQINTSFGRSQPNFTLRGVGVANEYNSHQASPVGVYVDEVSQTARFTQGMQLYDLDRVEVLRGPQGTLYGRNTTGGAINFFTRRPRLDGTNGTLSIGYGNFDTREADGAIEFTPVADKVGFRAAFNYIKSDGFTENVNPNGVDLNGENSISVRAALRLKPSDKLDINLKGYYSRSNRTRAAVFGQGVGVGGDSPAIRFLSGGALTYSRASLGFHQVDDPDRNARYFLDNRGVDLNVSWDASDTLKLTSITGWSSGRLSLDQDTDGTPLEILQVFFRAKYSQFSQELRANYSGINGLDLVVGGFYGQDTNRTANTFEFFDSLQTPGNPAVNLPPFNADIRFKQVRKTYAGFAHGIIDLSDRLKLTLGARYTHDYVNFSDVNAYLSTRLVQGGPFVPIVNTIPFGPFDPNAVFPAIVNTENQVTGVASLAYDVSDDVMLFASYTRGYRSGANNAGYVTPLQVQYIPPEKVNAYEVGIKSELLDKRLRINASAFYYDYKNQQVSEIVGAVGFIGSAGPATIKGAELDAEARLSRNLTLSTNLGILDTQYTGTGSLASGSLSGNTLPFAPKLTWRTAFDWDFAKISAGSFRLHADANYQSKIFFLPNNEDVNAATGNDARGLTQNSYWLFDTTLGFTSANEKIEVSLWAKNLLDKEYFVYGLDFKTLFGYDFFVPGSPRSYGARVKVKF